MGIASAPDVDQTVGQVPYVILLFSSAIYQVAFVASMYAIILAALYINAHAQRNHSRVLTCVARNLWVTVQFSMVLHSVWMDIQGMRIKFPVEFVHANSSFKNRQIWFIDPVVVVTFVRFWGTKSIVKPSVVSIIYISTY